MTAERTRQEEIFSAEVMRLFEADCEVLLDRKVRDSYVSLLARKAELAQAERDFYSVLGGL